MERTERISFLKSKIEEFKDEAFGQMLDTPKPEKKPKHVPPSGVHPRLYFTKNSIERIKSGLSHEENKYAYEKYIELSESECDGRVTDFTDQNSMSHMRIVDSNILTCLLAKAFRYAITGDELYGYEAVLGIKNYLSTFDLSQIPAGIAHYSSMRIMEKAACVYDWCYDLLTEKDKRQIASAMTSKIYKFMEYPTFPPTGGGLMVGHMCGTIFLIAWASVGIALYDEYPDYYDVIENVIQDKLVPSQNFFWSSGEHHAGCAYGPANTNSLLVGDLIFSAMYDNKIHLFDENLNQVCRTFLHMIRPDGEMLRIGDDYNEGTRYGSLPMTAYWSACLYKDPVLKGFARRALNNFSTFFTMSFTPVHHLIFNDVSVPCAPLSDLPLVRYNGSPMGSMYSRTSWSDPDAVMTYMKIGEAYAGGHEHKDAGNFQIFHKGILASKSGHYGLFGHPIDLAYTKQTVSCNSILVFNPNVKNTPKWPYCGGQRIDVPMNAEIMDAEDWQSKPSFTAGRVLYHDYKLEDGKLRYSCLCGDITGAYDEETVSEAKRYMFSLITDRDDHPLVFMTFDRVTSLSASYKKSLLLHMRARPFVSETPSGKKCAVITNLSSRLYVQSIGDEVGYNLVGGEGNQFVANGISYQKTRFQGEPFVFDYNVEEGWGRIEISPKKPEKTNCMLTVMYIAPDLDYSPKLVFGDSNVFPFREALEIKSEGVLGAAILGNAVVFPENGDGFNCQVKFTIPAEAKVKKCYVVGLENGKWQLPDGKTVEICDNAGVAEFDVTDTDITLTKC